MKKELRYPPDGGLPEQVRPYEETFSAFALLKETFFPERKTDE